MKIAWALVAALLMSAGATSQNENPEARKSALIERGKYIVEGVAMCGQCHTPRNSQGGPDSGQALQGAPLWLQPATPVGVWPSQAPRIAGILPGSDDQMVTLLTTGIWRDGKRPRPPMPQFRMTPQDAQAVVAYLRSMNPSPQ